VHVARHGDLEAARKLAGPNDKQVLKDIEALAYERQYPIEWTRLAALHLYEAQLRLATGDLDGATILISLHEELHQLLDPKAAKGPLGAVLLAPGRDALSKAATIWKKENRTELVAKADVAVADWGRAAGPSFAFPFGSPCAEIFGQPQTGQDVRAIAAAHILRAFDLFAMPFPAERADGVIAFFDESGKASDLLITYQSGLAEQYPEPGQLAQLLEDSGLEVQDRPKNANLRRRTYRFGDAAGDVSVVVRGGGAGALVHFSDSKEKRSAGILPRDFNGIHFERSFEQNRFLVAREQRGNKRLSLPAAKLESVRNPLAAALKPVTATVEREPGHNLVASLSFQYAADASGSPPLHTLLLPIWSTHGLGEFQDVATETGGHLAFAWQDSQTRYLVAVPYDSSQPVVFTASDVQGPESVAGRETRALAFDNQERKARMEAGKPVVRLRRAIEQIELGAHKTQIQRLLPVGRAVLKRDFAGGVTATFAGDPAQSDTYVVRQLFIRFDDAGRAVELRARYADGPAARGSAGAGELIERFKKAAGVPAEEISPWGGVWAELPPQKPAPALFQWQDDLTLLTVQRDSGGVEVTVQDRTPADNKTTLAPFEYLARGPSDCLLGVSRQELLQRWGVTKPVVTEDGALVLHPAATSRFDALLVWFDKDQASRIVARHRQSQGGPTTAAQFAQALSAAGSQELHALGWPRRQDLTPTNLLEGLGWHDDRTRVRIFWQESDSSPPRIFTEWKELQTLQPEQQQAGSR
jgi:hypothetical protein